MPNSRISGAVENLAAMESRWPPLRIDSLSFSGMLIPHPSSLVLSIATFNEKNNLETHKDMPLFRMAATDCTDLVQPTHFILATDARQTCEDSS